MRPGQPCNSPGCPGRTVTGGRCGRCRGARAGDVAEPDPGRIYTTRWWRQQRRPEYLAAHPFCTLCPAPAAVPDHYPVSRRVLVARGVADPDADEHLRPLCKRCHDRSTARLQPGGWNAR
jgi:5-methylcytosine-specific restriction protein A